MEHLQHHHDVFLIVLSVLIAMFASYTALDLTNSVTSASGKAKWLWLFGGSLAMGVGIWSMHFVGMLAFTVPGLSIYYDVPLLILSIVVAILASLFALYIVSCMEPKLTTYSIGSLVMGAAIAGMHYIGIWSMRMNAAIQWNVTLVITSILIAIVASFGALNIAFRLRSDISFRGFMYRGLGGVIMGVAISGMHYTAMAAMHLVKNGGLSDVEQSALLATDGLAAAVIVGTVVILGIALSGSNIERALAKRQEQNEILEASLKTRDQFFSLASHELKTPLTSIKLQNDLILKMFKKENPDIPKIQGMLERTGKNADRINRLVDDMLDISRMNTGKLSLQKESFELTHLVREVVERLMPLLESAGCKVNFSSDEEVTGFWDRFRLEQVFTNILTNAAKYAPGKPIDIKSEIHEHSVMVSIRDHGAGIPEEDQDKIFNKFERAKKESDSKGLGLGLYITREIIRMHNGSINVLSKPGDGAEFDVWLPV